MREVIYRFGVPLIIHSDQGRHLESSLFSKVCHLLGMERPERLPTVRNQMAWLKGLVEHLRTSWDKLWMITRLIETATCPTF